MLHERAKGIRWRDLRSGFCTSLCALIVLSVSVSVTWSQTIKIGVVDLQRVITGSKAGKKAKEKFQEQVKRAEAELLKQKQELELSKTNLDKKMRLAGEEEKRGLEREFQQKYRDYVRAVQDSQAELRQRDHEMTRHVLDDLREIVLAIGKREGFALILERSPVLYVGNAVDITDRVIEAYDKRQTKAPPTSS